MVSTSASCSGRFAGWEQEEDTEKIARSSPWETRRGIFFGLKLGISAGPMARSGAWRFVLPMIKAYVKRRCRVSNLGKSPFSLASLFSGLSFDETMAEAGSFASEVNSCWSELQLLKKRYERALVLKPRQFIAAESVKVV
jgi:hypothetical protein